jgi:hypothetical protein
MFAPSGMCAGYRWQMSTDTAQRSPARPRGLAVRQTGAALASLQRTSWWTGVAAAFGLVSFYVLVLLVFAGPSHLDDQLVEDWPWVLLLSAGFGTQVAVLVELRRRRRLDRQAGGTAGLGAGASAAGMVACCAHHVADLLPILGASGAAVFLSGLRSPLMAAGLAINVVGIVIAATRLRPFLVASPPPIHGIMR